MQNKMIIDKHNIDDGGIIKIGIFFQDKFESIERFVMFLTEMTIFDKFFQCGFFYIVI